MPKTFSRDKPVSAKPKQDEAVLDDDEQFELALWFSQRALQRVTGDWNKTVLNELFLADTSDANVYAKSLLKKLARNRISNDQQLYADIVPIAAKLYEMPSFKQFAMQNFIDLAAMLVNAKYEQSQNPSLNVELE